VVNLNGKPLRIQPCRRVWTMRSLRKFFP
jgi:hypothetical protein